jgi:glycosyltransferase involved in cell wall biosynthesis
LIERRPFIRERIELRFVGPEDLLLKRHVDELGLAQFVSYTGLVSYEESLEHISEATVCLLVEGAFEEGIFLPSKLCNYFAARKPVLAVSPRVGTVADLSERGGIVRVDHGNIPDMVEALTKLVDAYGNRKLEQFEPGESLAAEYGPQFVVNQIREALGIVLHKA